jgi:Cu/Ag efflux protein CusF
MRSNRTPALVLAAALAAGLAAGCGNTAREQPPPQAEETTHAPADAARTHVFKGRVQTVDPAAKTLTVTNENVEGWMMPMTMTYGTDKPEVFATVKPGDTITATVYDGDFKTLYNVQVVDGDSK